MANEIPSKPKIVKPKPKTVAKTVATPVSATAPLATEPAPSATPLRAKSPVRAKVPKTTAALAATTPETVPSTAKVVQKKNTASAPAAPAPIDLRLAIEREAYLRAERRGFEPGHEVEDWLAAEHSIGSGANV